MRVLLWHGWLLEGTGSNVYTARVAEELASEGHDVLLLCQESHPERYPWIDAVGTVGPEGPSALTQNGPGTRVGRCVLLRPEIGRLLPVFVLDEYEGFEVKRFLDLSDAELEEYLWCNTTALRAAVAWHVSEAVVTGHAIPGGAIGRRAVGDGNYVTKIHGSDVEYAIRLQQRYRDLALEGLSGARAVTGSSADVLERCLALVPGIGRPVRVIPPGVEVEHFRPLPRRQALLATAERLDGDADTDLGRPTSLDAEVSRALSRRDGRALDELARTYDQRVPDPDAAARLRALADRTTPLVGYFGKLIPQKGVELLLAGATLSRQRPQVLIVGFGLYREWLTALSTALRAGDPDGLAWLLDARDMPFDPTGVEGMVSPETAFTGRLDHRYAPGVLAALDVIVVPSILEEAFGMVAAEGAAAGALPLVARHSGLAEVAAALEGAVDRPGLFSFTPGAGAEVNVADGIDRLLALPPEEGDEIRRSIVAYVDREWSWRRTADRLLEAASG